MSAGASLRSSALQTKAAVERYPLIFLALLCLCLWLPTIMSLPVLDRDESRFAQSSKQMLESHDFVDIRFGAEARYNKPVGIYWLQAATTAVVGLGNRDSIWTYRLASLLGGIVSVWLSYWCCRAMTNRIAAVVGGGLLSATLLLSAEASIATTDAVLLACTLGAQGVLLRAYLGQRDRPEAMPGRALILAGWLALAVGILVKGPVAPAVCAVTILGLWLWDGNARWLKQLRPLAGSIIAALVVAPWLVAIALASHGRFFQQSLGHDFALKLVSGQETHGAPPGYYLALGAITLWPATVFLVPALRFGLLRRSDAAMRFLLTWSGGTWLLFELVPTKLPHYVLPAYPALTMLIALWMNARDLKAERPWQLASLGLFLAGLVVLIGAAIVLPARFGDGAGPGEIALVLAAGLAGLAALGAALRGMRLPSVVAAVVSAALIHGAVALDASEHVDRLWVSQRLAELVRHARPAEGPPVVSAGYAEPSLVFLLGTKTILTGGSVAASLLSQTSGLALIDDAEERAFQAGLVKSGQHAVALGRVSGLDYSRGRSVNVTLFRVPGRGPFPLAAKP